MELLLFPFFTGWLGETQTAFGNSRYGIRASAYCSSESFSDERAVTRSMRRSGTSQTMATPM